MTKFLILGLALFILWKLFMGDKNKKQENTKQEEDRMAATGEMVKDPVCGTYVRKDGDIRVRQGDAVHHFCSYDCRDKFLKRLEIEKKDEA